MRKIILFLPANVSRHGDLTAEGRRNLSSTLAGLPHIGRSGVKVATSFQTEDANFYPEVVSEAQKFNNIEILRSQYSHCLMTKSFIGNRAFDDQLDWQGKNGISGNVDVSFFSEFYIPEAKHILSEYFLVLGSQSYAYSLGFDWHGEKSSYSLADNYGDSVSLADTQSINFQGKIGLVMHEKHFGWFHKAFYRFQRNPLTPSADTNNKMPIDHLIDEIRRFAYSSDPNMPDDLPVIIPIDLEAPYVGSLFGEDIWKMFFEAIVANGLKDVFVSLKDNLIKYKLLARPASRPHRDLGPKWTRFDAQLSLLINWQTIQTKNHEIFAQAFASDLLSIYNRRITGKDKPVSFDCIDRAGQEQKVTLSWDKDVFETGIIALESLRKPHKTNYLKTLEKYLKRANPELRDSLPLRILNYWEANK